MDLLDIIRGLLASVPQCFECKKPATRLGARPSDVLAPHCDRCPCADPIDFSMREKQLHNRYEAPAIRAAVWVLAEAEAAPSGERVVWSEDGHPAQRLVAGPDGLRYEEKWRDEFVPKEWGDMRAAARRFLARAALAYVGATKAVNITSEISLVLRRAAGPILGYSDRFDEKHGFSLDDIAASMHEQIRHEPEIEWVRRASEGARAWLAVYETIARVASADTHVIPAADTERASLLSAAKLAARLLGTGHQTADFDAIADWFYAETHVMRPGKSVPLEMAGEHSDVDRECIYREWIAGKFKAARRALADAIQAADTEPAPSRELVALRGLASIARPIVRHAEMSPGTRAELEDALRDVDEACGVSE